MSSPVRNTRDTERYFSLRFWLEPRNDQARAPHWRGRVRLSYGSRVVVRAVDDPEQAFHLIRCELGLIEE
jgi:hypothetical protein